MFGMRAYWPALLAYHYRKMGGVTDLAFTIYTDNPNS
jgi:hypothetical protein